MDRNDDVCEDELREENASSIETKIYEPSQDADHTVAVTELRAGEEQESRVYFSSDEESPSEEVMQTTQDGMTDSAAVATVTAAGSHSAPAMTANADDAPPPLPTSLPPPSSALPAPDHDTSQDLSLIVEDDTHSAVAIIAASSPNANPEKDSSLTEMESGTNPATQLSGDDRLSPTAKYSTFSEDDRLLVQKMLATTKEHRISATEETAAAEESVTVVYTNNESEQKYSDLSQSDRKLIENTLASFSHSQPDARDVMGEQNADTVAELQSQERTDKNTSGNGLEEENASSIETKVHQPSQDGDQEPEKNKNEEIETNDTSLAEMKIQESLRTKDQEPDNTMSKHIQDVLTDVRKDDATSTEVVIQESLHKQEQELEIGTSDDVEDDLVGTTLVAEVKISESSLRTHQLSRDATSPPDDFETPEPSSEQTVNSHLEDYEEQTVVTLPEVHDTTASNSEEPFSANNFISTAAVPPNDVIHASGENEGGPVEVNNKVYPVTSVVVESRDGVDEVQVTGERRSATDMSSKSSDDVFRSSSSSSSGSYNVPSDAHSADAGADTLSNSRRTLLSDEAVSGILRDYYTADAAVEEQQKAPEKPKPVKPLIAQALLPKASRRAAGSLNSTTLSSLQTSSSFSSSKPGYHQVEIPRAVILSEKSDIARVAAEDDQRSKPLIGHNADDVTHGDVTVPGSVDSEAVRSSSVSREKSTNNDETRADGRQVPSVAESKAVTVKFSHATSSKTEDGEPRGAVEAALPQASPTSSAGSLSASSRQTAQPAAAGSSHVEVKTSGEGAPLETVTPDGELQASDVVSTTNTSSQPSTSSTSSLSTSPRVQTKVPKLTDARTFFESIGNRSDGDAGTASKGRVPLSTRWAPKPFSLAATTTKSTPSFVTFEPKLPAAKIPEATESDVAKDRPVEVTRVESRPSFNGFERTASAATSTEPKIKRSVSVSTTTTTAGASGGSTVGSSAADEGEIRSKSSDVKVDAARSIGLVDTRTMPLQAGDPQSPRDRHPPVSAAAMATELKKMGLKSPTRMPSMSGFFKAENSSSVVFGRSASVSQADVPPKSASSYGYKSTIRASPTATKSWTQFDYRKTVSPAPAEAASSPVGERKNRTSSNDADETEEHISAASSKAFFQAAELAEKQALNQAGAGKIGKKHGSTSSTRVVAPAKHDEKPLTAAEIDLTSSSESSCSTHSAPFTATHGKLAVIIHSL